MVFLSGTKPVRMISGICPILFMRYYGALDGMLCCTALIRICEALCGELDPSNLNDDVQVEYEATLGS